MSAKYDGRDFVEVVAHDLRALLHWAAYGVQCANGGSYSADIQDIVESYAKYMKMSTKRPEWGKSRGAYAAK